MASAPLAPVVLIAVDSGGTRTNVAIRFLHPEGRTVERRYEVDESLSGALPTEMVAITMRKILARLERELNEADIPVSSWRIPVHLWISAAGFTPWTRDDFLLSMEEFVPTLLNGAIRSAGAANDGVSLLLGSRANGIIVAGTGSTVILRASSGDLYQAGGHEWVACDDGAGFWIALRAIRRAYRDFEAGIDSVLLQRLRQCYNVRSGDDRGLIERLRDLAVGSKDMKKSIAHFAQFVCAAAERGDKDAQDIVKAEAEALADVTAVALRRCFTSKELSEGLRLVQGGSLIANPLYQLSFESQLDLRLLGDDTQKARFEWERVMTGSEAGLQLASDVANSPQQLLRLDRAFRPAVTEF